MGHILSKPALKLTSDGEDLCMDALDEGYLAVSRHGRGPGRIKYPPALTSKGLFTAVAFKYLPDPRLDYDEAAIGVNPMEICSDPWVQDLGPFSGIVRVTALFPTHEGEEHRTTGTAVIIDDYHVMTVGHNVWSAKYGLALSISIHRDGRADPNGLDSRSVDAGAVHFQWVKACKDAQKSKCLKKSSWAYDFAVLRVSEPFNMGCQQMKYKKTPLDKTHVSIYGFPYGIPLVKGVWQARLCLSRSIVTYAPTTSAILDHDGDTKCGSSGGPVVEDASGKVIALHRGFDKVDAHGKAKINKAVPLLFEGNDPGKFRDVIDILSRGESVDGSQIRKSDEFSIRQCTAACFGWD
ncbi:trypsin-like cysteine/serine peptidase domain-containing protein [Daldinia eschscholtzii]|nr:trypsin-like cysteine/serine peptidase domain-containing protein [Daldinia eschscholtzii]